MGSPLTYREHYYKWLDNQKNFCNYSEKSCTFSEVDDAIQCGYDKFQCR
jgi:hypothetical protein